MTPVDRGRPGLRDALIGFGVWLAGAAVFFRESLLTRLDYVVGDDYDGRLVAYLHEHLYLWLQGRARFKSPGFFYPQRNVLGYSEGELLDLPLYAIFRVLGADAFLSVHLLAVVLSLLCFACSALILTRFFGVRLWIALAAALLVTFPSNLGFKFVAGHTQFIALYYIPIIVLIALEAIREFPKITVKSVALTASAPLLYGLLFATSYNVAWLFALTCLIALIILVVKFWRELCQIVSQNLKSSLVFGASAVAGFLIGLIPFAIIYVPVLRILPRRGAIDYLTLAPRLIDVIKAPFGNLTWSWLTAWLPAGSEAIGVTLLAVTPGMMSIVLVLVVRAFLSPDRGGGSATARTVGLLAVGIWLIGWLITVRIGDSSIFLSLYGVLPGADAIRAGGRIQIFVNLWVVLALAVLLEDWLRTSTMADLRIRQTIAAVVLLFCLFEQINTTWRTGLARAQELARLDQVPRPPSECQAFLVAPPQPPAHVPTMGAQYDAMWIALKTGLPTLNGLSGAAPLNWRLAFWPNTDPLAEAHAWIKDNRMTQRICIYDRDKRHWAPFGQAGVR